MQEPPELGMAVRECMQGLEAVDHDQSRTPLLDRVRELLGNAGEPMLAYLRAEVFIEDRCPYRSTFKESQALPETDDLLKRFGNSCEIDRRAFRRRILEDILLSENCLATPRASHEEAYGIRGQAATKNCIEWFVPARKPVIHAEVSWAARRKELDPRRSLAVDTNCSGSNGFSKKASAPALIA